MTTTVNLRPLLDRKAWEACTPSPTASGAGHYVVSTPDHWPVRMSLFVQATGTHYMYFPSQDAYVDLPSGTLGVPAAGSCGAFHPYGPTGTATAGSSTTITTALNAVADLTGFTIRITAGTGAGQEKTITSNTFGAASVITTSAWSVTPDATSVYLILSGRFWCLTATGAAVTWKYYDYATNSWTNRSVTSGPATWAVTGQALATSGSLGSPIATGTATAGGATTLTNSGKSWTANQWANFQVRITAGTGAGQVRTINSNTGTALTVSAAWTTNPDNTSVYAIEGNDDWIWVIGNNAVTLFRYAINGIANLTATTAQATGDTWVTVTPGVARAGAAAAGCSWNRISASTDVRFTDENAILNGRRVYSFRGGGTSTLDYYDIPGNTWVSGVTYGNAQTTFTTGSDWCDDDGIIYGHKEATGRFFAFNVAANTLYPLSTLLYTQGAAVAGNGKVFIMSYTDGATTIKWLYNFRHTGTELFRMMIF